MIALDIPDNDIPWLRAHQLVGHAGEGTIERKERVAHNDRIARSVDAVEAYAKADDVALASTKTFAREQFEFEVRAVLKACGPNRDMAVTCIANLAEQTVIVSPVLPSLG